MWRLIGTVGLMILVACQQPKRVRVGSVDDEEGGLRSVVAVADPTATQQLAKGFHALEGGQWRWTQSRFAVTLRPPLGAEKKGAYVMLRHSVADSVLKKVGAVRLTANIGGVALEGETYTKNGDYVYRREVPASVLQGDGMTVEFAVDKFLKAGEVEERELALIVHMIGLEARE